MPVVVSERGIRNPISDARLCPARLASRALRTASGGERLGISDWRRGDEDRNSGLFAYTRAREEPSDSEPYRERCFDHDAQK